MCLLVTPRWWTVTHQIHVCIWPLAVYSTQSLIGLVFLGCIHGQRAAMWHRTRLQFENRVWFLHQDRKCTVGIEIDFWKPKDPVSFWSMMHFCFHLPTAPGFCLADFPAALVNLDWAGSFGPTVATTTNNGKWQSWTFSRKTFMSLGRPDFKGFISFCLLCRNKWY